MNFAKRIAALLAIAGLSAPAMADVIIKGKTGESVKMYSGTTNIATFGSSGTATLPATLNLTGAGTLIKTGTGTLTLATGSDSSTISKTGVGTLTLATGSDSSTVTKSGTGGLTLATGANAISMTWGAAATLTMPTGTATVASTSNKISDFSSSTSSELAGKISDETGSGLLVFATQPTFTTDITTPIVKSAAALSLQAGTSQAIQFAAGATAAGTHGNISSAGQWTVGPAGGANELALTHTVSFGKTNNIIFQELGGASPTSVVVKLDGTSTSTNAMGYLAAITAAGGGGVTGSSAGDFAIVAKNNLIISANNGGAIHGSVSNAGAWVIGPTASNSFSAHTNTMNGSVLSLSALNSSDANEEVVIQQFPKGTYGTALTTQIVTDSGTEPAMRFTANVGGNAAIATRTKLFAWWNYGTEVGMVSPSGAWTLGPSTSSISVKHRIYHHSSANTVGNAAITFDQLNGTTAHFFTFAEAGVKKGHWSSSANYPFGVGDSSGTDIGFVASSGAWTLGAATGVAEHTINGPVLMKANQVGSVTQASLQLEGTGGDHYPLAVRSNANTYWYWSAVSSSNPDAYYMYYTADGGTTPVQLSKVTETGVWELGSANTTNYHLIAHGTALGTPVVVFKKYGTAAQSNNNYYLLFQGGSGSPIDDGYLMTNGSAVLTIIDNSDIRLKENIRNATYGLSTIMALRPVEFDWKSGVKNVKGFIAQEVKSILPESVTITDQSDRGGFSDAHFLETQTMIPVLVKAVQEQQDVINGLKQRIEALEATR